VPQTQFTLGAFAIIFDNHQRVLLSHRRDMDAWNLPGGGVESGETPVEAVIREVTEETGLEVAVDHLVGVYTNARRDDIVFAFVCHVTGGALRLTDESSDHRYCNLSEIPRNITPKNVERITEALKGGDQPIFRHQSGPTTREWLQHLDEECLDSTSAEN
jgi:ADP-ribose pyrophosphatase YjhB (NUDIX family)